MLLHNRRRTFFFLPQRIFFCIQMKRENGVANYVTSRNFFLIYIFPLAVERFKVVSLGSCSSYWIHEKKCSFNDWRRKDFSLLNLNNEWISKCVALWFVSITTCREIALSHKLNVVKIIYFWAIKKNVKRRLQNDFKIQYLMNRTIE